MTTTRWFALPALALLLAGCGRAAPNDQVASLTGNGAGPTASSSAAVRPEDALREFARCMRQHGVNVPDPQVTTGGSGGVQGKITINAPSGAKTKVDAAQRACQRYLPRGGTLDPDDPQALDRALALARCLRQHGLNVPDPKPGQPGVLIQANGKNDEKTRKAMQACAPSKAEGGVSSQRQDGGSAGTKDGS